MQFKHQFKWIPVLLSALILCVMVLPSAAESAGPEYDPGSLNYELVWADEFDTDGLPDPARWALTPAETAGETVNSNTTWLKETRPLKTESLPLN